MGQLIIKQPSTVSDDTEDELAGKTDNAAAAITGGTIDGATVGGITPAQQTLIHLGAKSTIPVTMNAFGTWADGQTIVLPAIGSHTLKVTAAGDIDIVGLGEAAAKAAIVAYLTAHAGATVSVAIVGTSTTMTVTALAYGPALNDTVISGTMLAASGTMAEGRTAQIPVPPASALEPGTITPAMFAALTSLAADLAAKVPAAHTANAQTGTTYTLAATDAYEAGCALVTLSNAAGITVTVPKNATIPIAVGVAINCQQIGAGQVTFAPEDGAVTINPVATLKLTAQWAGATLIQTAANVWSLIGSLSA